MLDIEQYQVIGATAREIAASAEESIRARRLDSGEALPTVRALAAALGTSPATVNAAYRILRGRGLIVTDGRRGTRVAPRPALWAPEPMRRFPPPGPPPPGKRDLAVGLPDPELLPSLGDAIARLDLRKDLPISEEAADPELLEHAAAAFAADGIPSGSLAIVSGAFDGIERVLQAQLRPGDRVLIEDPAYTSIRDLLLALGLVAVAVPVDDQGPEPEAFAAALRRDVQAAVIVPRAQNPYGAAIEDERATTLRTILTEHPGVLVVEDDHAGAVSGAPSVTLVGPERRRWAVLRSASKVLHPDLRLALLAGDETTVARVQGRQGLGPRWVSHLLQATVVELLRDPRFPAVTARAREVYSARRRALIAALLARGLQAHGRSGLNVWVPVREEAPVIRALYEAGWIALAGERFRIASPPGIRITIASLGEDQAPEVAEVIAAVEQASRSPRQY